MPTDIAACEQTSQLYFADNECIWRVSSEGAGIHRWPPKSSSDRFGPWTLSVTAARLLVTSRDTKQLMQFDVDGDELRRVRLPGDGMELHHAVESPTGTFIVSHRNTRQQQVSEFSADGQVLRQFSASGAPPFGWTPHVAVDSRRGDIFVADSGNCRVLLLDAQLALRRVIIDEHQLNDEKPQCVRYVEQSGHLLVGTYSSAAVFDVLRR